MTKYIRIVLVEPSHPGNIGATARAMKTMGLMRLYLVNPLRFPDEEAVVRAGRAVEILDNAVICSNLNHALFDCGLVFGTSARDRALNWPAMSPEGAAQKTSNVLGSTDVAFVFGRERTGLTNEELAACHIQINIPTNPDYPSLNLASAVQIVTYEIYKQLNREKRISTAKESVALATSQEIASFYDHLEKTLIEVEFLDPALPKHLMARLKRLFGKAELEQQEVNILRGILTAVRRKIN
ncbi:MAG: RNA methyltransferase [Gammaproteobacteria bacterium]